MPVRQRQNPAGTISWQVDVRTKGKPRYQRSFPTKKEAVADEARLRGELRAFGTEALAMSHADRLRYAEAAARLEARGLSLETAVQWALDRAGVPDGKLLGDLFPTFIAHHERTGNRPRYVKQLQVSVGGFIAGREDLEPRAITRAEIENWLFGQGWAPKTQKNYLGDVSGFFRWMLGKRGMNPCEDVKPMKAVPTEISALSPEMVERLFTTAVSETLSFRDPHTRVTKEEFLFRRLLGYLALATFCGIRPAEIERSGPKALDLEHHVFVVAGDVAKTARRRVVDLPPAALRWIVFWRKVCGENAPIIPNNFRKLWERLRERAELKPPGWPFKGEKKNSQPAPPPWPSDVLRHTCATMHFATHQNAALLKAQLGHVEKEDTLFSNYRAVRLLDSRPVSKVLAAKFWASKPPSLASA